MTDDRKYKFLHSLLDRLEADANLERPLLGSLVSKDERRELRELLEEVGGLSRSLPSKPAASVAEPETPPSGGDEPESTQRSDQPPEQPSFARMFADAGDALVFRQEASPRPDWTLCLDFGTAKSKAFACRVEENEVEESLDMPLGKADDDLDGAVYTVNSSVWIDDDGLMFAGSEAVKRGREYGDPARRQRIDSIKQEISQVMSEHDLGQRLDAGKNPISLVPLTYRDVITFYLAYLTDLAGIILEENVRVRTRYVRRRFTLPWWNDSQRAWAEPFIARALVRAQVLADIFHGRWNSGIHVKEVSHILGQAASRDAELTWLLESGATTEASATLEALAAASARVWKGRDRGLVLVVDVGAGTTDISLFWRAQDKQDKAFPVAPCATAIRQAGDTLDSLLLQELLHRGNLGADRDLTRRVRDGLRRRVRRMKETLFLVGRISESLVNDERVELTKEEFLRLEGISSFEEKIREVIQNLLDEVHESWRAAVDSGRGITLVLTGGGCKLPMVRDLENEEWRVGGRRVRCRFANDVPDFISDEFDEDFVNEYPQLAVAVGGAMPHLLDERDALREFLGGDTGTRTVRNPPGGRWTG